MKFAIGVDIGATLIKSAVVSNRGDLLSVLFFPTPTNDVFEKIVELIGRQLNFIENQKLKVEGVGVGIPGVVDRGNGRVIFTLNLGWKKFDFVRQLKFHYNSLPICIDVDRNVGLLGESNFGVVRKCQNIILLSWGSGVACSLMINGKIYRGSHAVVTEFGHTTIDRRGKLCKCGQKGCIGAYSGGKALTKKFFPLLKRDRVRVENWEVIKIANQLAIKDKRYRNIFLDAIEKLAMGLANLCNIVDPDKIIISGGLSNLDSYFFDHLQKYVVKYVQPTVKKYIIIERAKFREKSGIVGAASLFF